MSGNFVNKLQHYLQICPPGRQKIFINFYIYFTLCFFAQEILYRGEEATQGLLCLLNNDAVVLTIENKCLIRNEAHHATTIGN